MSTTTSDAASTVLWQAAAPAIFVLLWSLGFIFAKLGIPYAEPFTFLALRFVIVMALLLPVALVTGAPWPRSWRMVGHIAVVGILLHATYLGGTYAAIAAGVPAGIAALIVGLQPLLTATLAGPALGERVGARQWLGLGLGFLGVLLVLWEKLSLGELQPLGYVCSFVALLGITAATLYQKRYCATMDLRSGGVIQYAAASAVVAALAFGLETRAIAWTGEFVFALACLVLLLSVGAIGLLTWLIRHGAAARVASLFYLVPPLAALEAYFIFGERLGAPAIAGMAMAVVGVALAIRPAAVQPVAD